MAIPIAIYGFDENGKRKSNRNESNEFKNGHSQTKKKHNLSVSHSMIVRLTVTLFLFSDKLCGIWGIQWHNNQNHFPIIIYSGDRINHAHPTNNELFLFIKYRNNER